MRVREFTNLLNKSKRLPEVVKSEAPLNAASFVGQLPVWGLCTKELLARVSVMLLVPYVKRRPN